MIHPIVTDHSRWWLSGLWTLNQWFFITSKVIWCHCDDGNITLISDLPEGVYIKESHIKTKNKKEQCQAQKHIFVVYTRTICLIASGPFFQEFYNMSKIHHMKNVMEDLNDFRKYYKAKRILVMRFKPVSLLLKMSFKRPLKLIYLIKNKT